MSIVSEYKAIQKLVESAQPKWISVEERLPEKDGTYIVFIHAQGVNLVDADQYTIGNGWYEWGNHSGITHWMPLPQAPEVEKDA